MSRTRVPTKTSRPPLRGRFITFEGIDGCGKTTQAKLLARRLEHEGHSVLLTREPGGTPIGKALRRVLLDPHYRAMVPECEVLLFLADRTQHLAEVIRPALARGDIVICDRFHDATVAYQQHARRLDFKLLAQWTKKNIHPMPNYTVWLDLDVRAALQRLLARGADPSGKPDRSKLTRIELNTLAFHNRIRDGYRNIAAADPKRVERIDAAQTIEAMHGDIWARLTRRYRL